MRRIFITILMLLAFTSMVLAEDITISSSVDRNDVEFGDTIELTVQIKKPTESTSMKIPNGFSSNAFSFSFNSSSFSSISGGLDNIDFDIEAIPDFDIAGKRQSSQMRSINGVGESIKQLIITLVPQKVGTLVIPAFSIKDKEGKEHTSKPLMINVKSVADDPAEEESVASATNESDNQNDGSNTIKSPEAKKENTLFNVFLLLGLILVIVIVGIIAFAYFFDSIGKSNNQVKDNNVEDAVIVKEESKPAQEPVKEEKVENVEFETISASLKFKYKEICPEFYKEYFELFKKACCYRSKTLTQDMTFDELLKKCSEIAGTDNIVQATSRLSHDIEMVMYAGSMPNRQLIAIETDIKEVLNSL